MNGSEEFDRAIEDLLADRSPRAEVANLSGEEQQMLRVAQLLRGSRPQSPDPEFVEGLHERIFPSARKVSRRTAFVSGFGALAAGVLAGVGIDRAAKSGSPGEEKALGWRVPIVGQDRGTWVHVADVAEVPAGAIRTFTAGPIQGFLINRGGQLRALSRTCTHMGCALNFLPKDQSFVCPCHGAEFDLSGTLRGGPGGYYEGALRPLPKIQVRVRGNSIQVFTV